ncbi:alpha/beta hydrolase [Desulfosporosinus sp. OT]|uniref:alpha/beta hydrolase n=1 Tax=Desulfosporosinus sp. OT TaxID=913865 RepID=UPI0002239AF0|nr:alpha/beta hydrolase [Desulfosporosinus sp. OT]EGW40898.1 alpha/beta hydrolase fold family protein [Desulfosporosinus sp. OT]
MNETIVMIHGMWCGAWVWDNYKTFFKQNGFDCITPSLRFHDVDSNEPPNPEVGIASVSDYVEDIKNIVNTLEKPPILMGHSMGGMLAQIVGSQIPTKAIICITTAGPFGISLIQPLSVLRSFISISTKWNWWKKPMRQTFNEAAYSMLHLLPIEEQRRIYNRLVFDSGRALFETSYMNFDSEKACKFDEFEITSPILFISAKEDRIIPSSSVKKCAAKYMKSTYKEFDDHAHWIIGEPGWQDVSEYINRWIGNNLG